ncbi:hypothetical protein ACJVC5_09985 [Peredibacter sp. HCB2-198]|uniref:hypothetical protein n=1 Tax=Peredibacter sp. HCB2-198 TaxID=3383025 RepID=UPI0038B5EAF6
MKSIFLLGIFISVNSLASTDCYLYEVKGVARIKGSDLELVVNEKTMSEMRFGMKISDTAKFGPYLDSTTKGEYVFKGKPVSKSVIQEIKSLKRSTPDPLNHQNHSYIKELKAIECPK